MYRRENNSPMPKSILAVAAILAILGIGSWIYQLIVGMQVTGLDNNVVWGLYIAFSFVVIGGGAALLAIVGISEFKNILSPDSKSRILLLSITTFIGGGILITIDLGNPIQVFRIATSFKFQSLLVWDFWLLALCFFLALFYLVKVRKDNSGGKVYGLISIAAALFLIVAESFLLSSMLGHHLWESGMTLISFLISAAVVGSAFILLLMPDNRTVRNILLATLVFSLIATLAEVFTGALTGNPETKTEMMLLLSGQGALYFWGQVLIGLILPLFLLLKSYKPIAIALLSIFGTLMGKVWLLALGQWVQGSLVYIPSLPELITIIGTSGIGVLLYGVLVKAFEPKASPKAEQTKMSVA